MKYIFLFLLMIGFVSASCVDINSPSLEELDELTGIGPSYAQDIIDARPYNSLNDLTNAKNIAEKRLQKIIDQGLACVDGVVEEEIEEDSRETIETEKDEEIVLSSEPLKMISLNANVGSESVYESKDSKIMNYLPYAFSVFLIGLLGILIWERF